MAEWQDDPSVQDRTNLYRRVRRDRVFWDDSRECWRPSSVVFQNFEMSVALGDTLEADGREPVDVLTPYPDEFLVLLEAGFVRGHDQIVAREPRHDEPAHGLVVGDKERPASRRKKFAQSAEWAVPPTESAPPSGSNRLP